jgi:transposase
LTVVYQINDGAKRLLWIGMDRTAKSLTEFFETLGEEGCAGLKYVCSDMWAPYLGVIARKAKAAIHVLDRFHIMQRLNKAIDEVRASEARRLQAEGRKPILKHSRWCILKRPANLTGPQAVKMAELLKQNLQTVRAYLHREDFQRFWTYYCPRAAGRFLKDWSTRVLRSRIEPMKKVARTLRRHEGLLLNWVRAYGTISAGTVEGLNPGLFTYCEKNLDKESVPGFNCRVFKTARA